MVKYKWYHDERYGKRYIIDPPPEREEYDTLVHGRLEKLQEKDDIYNLLTTDEYLETLIYYGQASWGEMYDKTRWLDHFLHHVQSRLSIVGYDDPLTDLSALQRRPVESDPSNLHRELFVMAVLGYTAYLSPFEYQEYAVKHLENKLGAVIEFNPFLPRLLVGFNSEPLLALVGLKFLLNGIKCLRVVQSLYTKFPFDEEISTARFE